MLHDKYSLVCLSMYIDFSMQIKMYRIFSNYYKTEKYLKV